MYAVMPAGQGLMTGEPAPSQQPGGLVRELIELAGFLKELETQAHLVHLNYEGDNFFSVHEFLKSQYEAHLAEFDEVAEYVRALDNFMPMCSCGLKESVRDFENCASYDGMQMLMTYLMNLDGLVEKATAIEAMAGEARAIDVQNYMAELVAAANKAAWFLKATLRGC
jgi:starvation-inducible DNA-binding protein